MKQTNNAIKFLMAQYRAIFQNAYFKGLATAAVVTMGLAAGQAQAAADITSIDDLATAGDKVIATGTDVDLTADTNSAWKANLTISSGGSSGHTLKAKADGNKVTGTGSLILQNSDASKLTIGDGSEAKGLSVDISAITISQGELAIVGGKGKTTSVTANNVSVGGAGKTATLTIKATAASDVASFGKAATASDSASVTTLKENGKIVFNAEDAATSAGAVLLGQLKSTGGSLDFTGHGTSKAWGTAEKLDINVAAKKTAVIELADVPETTDNNEGKLSITEGTIKLTGDSATAATLNIKTGTVELGENVVISAHTTGTKEGVLSVGGTTTKAALVFNNKETLNKFLAGTSTVASAAKGALDLGQSGSVVVKGDIDLKDYTFSTAAGTSGSINAAASNGATLAANNITVDKTVSGAANLTFEAKETLTLGSTDAEVKAGAALKTKKLELIAKNGEAAFKLQDEVTLQATSEAQDTDGKTILVSDNGSIDSNGKAINVSGGGLTVAAGNYSFTGDVTINDGSIKLTSAVSNQATTAKMLDSKLTIAGGDITIANKDGNTLSVDGANAVLDISGANNVATSKAGSEEDIALSVTNSGTLIMKGEHVTSFVGAVTGTEDSKVASILLDSNGVLKVDSLDIAFDTLKSGNNSSAPTGKGVIQFDNQNDNSGKLEVTDTLTLKDFDTTALAIGEHGKIQAGTLELKLKNTSSATDIKLGAGQYTVLNGLTSDKEVDLQATSSLSLGKVKTEDSISTPLSSGGSINQKLNISAGSVSVVAGDWIAEKDVTATPSTSLTIGKNTTVDADGNQIHAGLKVNGLLTATAGVSVAKGSSLEANAIDAKAAAITVSGDVTILGKQACTFQK